MIPIQFPFAIIVASLFPAFGKPRTGKFEKFERLEGRVSHQVEKTQLNCF